MAVIATIQEAIQDLQLGKSVIVVDDEDRENEGDLLCAAEFVTPEIINFMTKEARGLICVAVDDTICERLNLEMMVRSNTSKHDTPFTVSIDLIGEGCTTGISAQDRSKTILAMLNEQYDGRNFARPGHIFPLKAKAEGVLKRSGHTEAAVDLMKLSGLQPAGVLVEIMREDGAMACLPELIEIAEKFQFKIISIKDLIAFRLLTETFIKREVSVKLPTHYGDFDLIAFTQTNSNELHLALIKGVWTSDEPVLVRVHSSCYTGDILGSLLCDCGEQLHMAMRMVQNEGKGCILYMNQEGRGIGLINKLHAYKLQEQGHDTVEANLKLGFGMDQRDYGIGAQILRDLNIHKIKLMTNNPRKRIGLIGYGIEIVENIPILCDPNPHNTLYLQTKKEKLGHEL